MTMVASVKDIEIFQVDIENRYHRASLEINQSWKVFHMIYIHK